MAESGILRLEKARRVELKKFLTWFFGISGIALLAITLFLLADSWTSMGKMPSGAWLTKAEASENYGDGQFQNHIPEQQPDVLEVTQRWFGPNAAVVEPTSPPPIEKRTRADFNAEKGLRATWLGHSTMLIEIDGKRILTDPVWGERVSPFSHFGPIRFHEPPLPRDEVPVLDAILISHDHYDHLDEFTVMAFKTRNTKYFVPLGVGSHLEYWGVPRDQIVELDWWEEAKIDGITLAAVPSRHFSGRQVMDRNKTQWASWVVKSKNHSVFFSGDTAMHRDFVKIGHEYGPFDATFMEVGAYNQLWADVHLGPEQAVSAHKQVGGGIMFPVHWGTFNLALHAWTEPAERLAVAAKEQNVKVVIPKPGQIIDLADPPKKLDRWWPEVPWETAAQHPVVSSGL